MLQENIMSRLFQRIALKTMTFMQDGAYRNWNYKDPEKNRYWLMINN